MADIHQHRDEELIQPRANPTHISLEVREFLARVPLVVQEIDGYTKISNLEQIEQQVGAGGEVLTYNLGSLNSAVAKAYLDANFAALPKSKQEFLEILARVGKENAPAGWNGDNFRVARLVAEFDHVELTLEILPNKVLQAEQIARKDPHYDPQGFATNQLHASVVAIARGEDGGAYLATQLKADWANNGGFIETSDGRKIPKVHPAQVAGGTEINELLEAGRLSKQPALATVAVESVEEIGLELSSSNPIAILHEGVLAGHANSNGLPLSQYCNFMTVRQHQDGSAVMLPELRAEIARYADLHKSDQNREVKGNAYVSLDSGEFEVLHDLGREYLIAKNVEIQFIEADGRVSVRHDDVAFDSNYTGILKYLLTDGDPLREKILTVAGLR